MIGDWRVIGLAAALAALVAFASVAAAVWLGWD
jgi:hypothetical protein